MKIYHFGSDVWDLPFFKTFRQSFGICVRSYHMLVARNSTCTNEATKPLYIISRICSSGMQPTPSCRNEGDLFCISFIGKVPTTCPSTSRNSTSWKLYSETYAKHLRRNLRLSSIVLYSTNSCQ